MLNFPDFPLPREDSPTAPSVEPPSETASETISQPLPKIAPEPPTPWATVVHRFTSADDDAYRRLNADFGLTLDAGSFARLQALFRTILRRDPTVGELFLLCELDHTGCRQTHRRAMGELYTNSTAIAETWADMMAKHSELYVAAGLLRKETRTPPPCTVEDALSLIGRYLHRRGLVAPLPACLPHGEKNSEGRTVLLSTLAQEADAVAEGYVLLKRLDFGNATRSLWVRRGPALAITPAAAGDFLICLSSPDPQALAELLAKERKKRHPSVGAIAALSSRSPLEVVLTLCDGADIYPARLPRAFHEIETGSSPMAYLCKPPVLTPDTLPDYLLRIPAQRIREMIEALRGAGIAAVHVGQVKTGEQIRIYLQQGNRDMPVAKLSASILRTYPSMTLYRCQAEDSPTKDMEFPSPVFLDLPAMGLAMVSTAVTVMDAREGYTAAMNAISAAVSPLTAEGLSTREIRLSVSILAVGGEGEQDNSLTGIVCGLYRAAAEGGMAMEDPALTRVSPHEGQSPALHLSVVAFRPSYSPS
ncbi:MAG: hypothetical protein IKM33_04530 [Clostridia bacterium]|nr:hypothetical protein [Clostridia bacterium]